MQQHKWLGFHLLASLLIALSASHAVEPDWYLQTRRLKYFLQEGQSLPAAHYTGNNIHLSISPSRLDPKVQQLDLNFPAGTVLEDVTLEVRELTTLTLRNCILRRVALVASPRATINLQSCALESCYVSSDSNKFFRSNRAQYTLEEVYAEIGVPKVNMTDCVLASSTLVSPYLSGLNAARCTFLACVLEASPEDGTQSSTRYAQCAFTGSKITSVEMLLTTDQCCFKECECLDVLSFAAGSQVVKPVRVQLAWENGNPALPAKTGNGKVSFELINAALEAGSTQAHQWDGSHLKITDFAPAGAAAPQPLQQVWKMIDFNTLFMATSSSNAPGSPSQSGGRTSPGRAPIIGTLAAAGVTFQSRINQVNGLLISQLSAGGVAGQSSRMSLTALPSLGGAPSTLQFNQDVGKDMEKALNEVSKFSQLRHNGWPAGHAMEIGFEEKYIDKDGPSAAVACALLLEAALTGKKWDTAFAVTGDMNADGSVQPIGGVQAKIRGATKGACKLVGVPVKNEMAVADLLLLDGPAPLIGITVFGIKTFEEAVLLADTERPPALQSALTDFDNMRAVMMRDPRQILPLLRTPHAAQRLQALLAAAPNCYSAKYLLLYLQGRAPRSLSIGGSIEAAQSSAKSILSAIDHDLDSNMTNLKGDELGSSLNKLRQLRPLLDQRVWPYVDHLVAYGEIVRGSVLNPVRSGARYNDLVGKAKNAANGAGAAYDKLLNEPQVREELGL